MMRGTLRFVALVVLLGAIAVMTTTTLGGRQARAQEPQTVQPGTAAIWTDKQQYQIGEPIQICYRIPVAGNITITDLPADGTTRVFYTGPSSGTSGCMPGVVTPPPGTECMRLTYPLLGGNGQTQTCFQVVGQTPPPPPPGVAIFTDRSSYQFGSPIQVCYRVPSPGNITITDFLADGSSHTFFSGYDDGTGGCIPGTVTPPAGTECMQLNFTSSTGGQTASTQTCFQVIGPTPPPPPTGWTVAGTAVVDANGNWNFDGQVTLPLNQTYVRVTSGTCDADPASTLVWESNLQQQSTGRLGVSVWVGALEPTGLAVSSGGSGSAHIARPVTQNPATQVDLSLFSVGIVYNGTTLTACFRGP